MRGMKHMFKIEVVFLTTPLHPSPIYQIYFPYAPKKF